MTVQTILKQVLELRKGQKNFEIMKQMKSVEDENNTVTRGVVPKLVEEIKVST